MDIEKNGEKGGDIDEFIGPTQFWYTILLLILLSLKVRANKKILPKKERKYRKMKNLFTLNFSIFVWHCFKF